MTIRTEDSTMNTSKLQECYCGSAAQHETFMERLRQRVIYLKDGELANYPTQNKCIVPPLYKRGRCGRDKLKVVQDEAARPPMLDEAIKDEATNAGRSHPG